VIYLGALSMILIAATLWFMLRPLARSSQAESQEEFQQLLLVRERLISQLNEIDIEDRDRNMDPEIAADERRRVEGDLAVVLKKIDMLASASTSKEGEHVRTQTNWRSVAIGFGMFVPVVAIASYLINATVSPADLERMAATPAAAPTPQQPAGTPPLDPNEMVARLANRLKENPNNPQGWLRLGRSYVVLERPKDAEAAYAQAYKYLPKDYVPQAQVGEGGQVDPGIVYELWYLGGAAEAKREYARAIKYWSQLVSMLPGDVPAVQKIQARIDAAKAASTKKK
jgi:cytochrome c-type biogenesis protein CcmH